MVFFIDQHIGYFKEKPLNIPKITILLDNGYHPKSLTKALEIIYPEIMTKIQFELSPKPTKKQKDAVDKKGFVPVKVHWVVEHSNAWIERCKILVKNFERTLDNANDQLKWCFVRLMLKRVASNS